MEPTELIFEVPGAAGVGVLKQSAWAWRPTVLPRGLLVCFAGGTYDKRYWHLVVRGHPGYSFGEHLAGLGWVVVAVDHLGVGGSSDPIEDVVGLDVLRDGDIDVVRQIRRRVDDGTLLEGLAPQPGLPLVGVGHSMGACLTTMVQAVARPYVAVALLGYGVDISNVRAEEGGAGALEERVNASETAFRQTTSAGDARFHVVPRALLRPLFHAPDVPEAVCTADDAAQSRVPVRAASEVTTPGFVRSYAADVDVPVLLAFGGVLDVSPDPWAETQNYGASRDITLVVLDGAAHCHNMASGRAILWNRISAWAATVAHPVVGAC